MAKIIKLTEDKINVGWYSNDEPYSRIQILVKDDKEGNKIKQQILTDYKKARTYDEIAKIIPEMYKDWKSILPQLKQNQKLRELIEKILPTVISKAEALDDFESGNFIKKELQKLLEESEK